MAIKALIVGCGAIIVSACAPRALQPTTSDFLRTTAAGFLLTRSVQEVRYYAYFDVIAPVAREIELNVAFENPIDPTTPLIQQVSLVPGQTELKLQSAPLSGLRDGEIYGLTIVGRYSDLSTPFFEHKQKIEFIRPPGF